MPRFPYEVAQCTTYKINLGCVRRGKVKVERLMVDFKYFFLKKVKICVGKVGRGWVVEGKTRK